MSITITNEYLGLAIDPIDQDATSIINSVCGDSDLKIGDAVKLLPVGTGNGFTQSDDLLPRVGIAGLDESSYGIVVGGDFEGIYGDGAIPINFDNLALGMIASFFGDGVRISTQGRCLALASGPISVGDKLISSPTGLINANGGKIIATALQGATEQNSIIAVDVQREEIPIFVPPDDWFDLTFKSRIPLTINSSQVISGPQTNFQMLVDSTFGEMAGKVLSQGQDIRFAGIDKVQLPYEIEAFDGVSKLTAWTKKTIDTGTIIYMYFNKPSASDAQTPASVWNVNNVATWHMNQTSFGANSTIDSTANNNFTPQNMDNTNESSGKIDGALDFNLGATVNEESIGTSTSLDPLIDNFTVYAWATPESLPINTTRALLGRDLQWLWGISDVSEMFMLFAGVGFQERVITGLSVGVPIQLAIAVGPAVPAGGTRAARYFANGSFVTSVNFASDPTGGVGSWAIAAASPSGASDWKGGISEQRVYSEQLSDAKIQTMFNNENDPGEPSVPGFYTVGAIQNI